eukprot:GHVU01158514.1.p1 GENE.GHVU01158514.1~~GHVU01158514.1.p1  ORF type:complete len:169 (-),score=16.42 GHVU01158514.1:184-690(-)
MRGRRSGRGRTGGGASEEHGGGGLRLRASTGTCADDGGVDPAHTIPARSSVPNYPNGVPADASADGGVDASAIAPGAEAPDPTGRARAATPAGQPYGAHRVAVVWDPTHELHVLQSDESEGGGPGSTGSGHPERPARVTSILRDLRRRGLLDDDQQQGRGVQELRVTR